MKIHFNLRYSLCLLIVNLYAFTAHADVDPAADVSTEELQAAINHLDCKKDNAVILNAETFHLDLSNCHLSSSSKLFQFLDQLVTLQSLDLSSNHLTSLPESVMRLSGLTQLNLSGNQLSHLPETIDQLSQLTELYLRSNQLVSLLDSIAQLSQLTALDLRNNQLIVLPATIGQLSNLNALYLEMNKLDTLPDSISQLTQLSVLDLRHNPLTSLPSTISQLSHLTRLYLHEDMFNILPIEQLTPITVLNLSNSQRKHTCMLQEEANFNILSEACIPEYTHVFEKKLSYRHTRSFYMIGNKKEYIGQCQQEAKVYPHEEKISDCSTEIDKTLHKKFQLSKTVFINSEPVNNFV